MSGITRFRLLALLSSACLWSVSLLATTQVHGVLGLLALAFVPYGLLIWSEHRSPSDINAAEIVAWTLFCGLGLSFTPSILSDDVFRFVWDARVLSNGINPYAHPPNSDVLAELRNAGWAKINNPEIITIYPPVAQLWFWVVTRFSESIWSLKVAALLAHGAVTYALCRFRFSNTSRLPALLFGLNPMCLSESALGGHVDVLVGLTLLLCAWSLQNGKQLWAASGLFLASGLKLVGIACVPLLKKPSTLVLATLLTLAPVVSMVASTGEASASGVTNFAGRWSGNASVFALFRSGSAAALRVVFPGDDATTLELPPKAHRFVRLNLTTPPIVHSDTLIYTRGASELVARALSVLGLLVALLFIRRRSWEPLHQLRALLWCVLLLSPQVHPWYLLWLLPVEAAANRVSGFVWSALVLLAYLPLDRWIREQVWQESILLICVQYILVFLVLFAERKKTHALT